MFPDEKKSMMDKKNKNELKSILWWWIGNLKNMITIWVGLLMMKKIMNNIVMNFKMKISSSMYMINVDKKISWERRKNWDNNGDEDDDDNEKSSDDDIDDDQDIQDIPKSLLISVRKISVLQMKNLLPFKYLIEVIKYTNGPSFLLNVYNLTKVTIVIKKTRGISLLSEFFFLNIHFYHYLNMKWSLTGVLTILFLNLWFINLTTSVWYTISCKKQIQTATRLIILWNNGFKVERTLLL